MIILESVDTPFGHIKIMQSNKDGTTTYYQGECFQSQVNTEGVSTCAYIHVMKEVMLSAKPKSVLLIGGAGGSLATLLHRAGCDVTMVDVNDYAFTLAKRYFQLPVGVECIASDGFAYLQGSDKKFDAIAVDAFNGRGVIPPQMRKKDFFRLLKEAVGENGVAVMNVMTSHDLDMEPDRIAERMNAAGLPVVLYDWPGYKDRNTLVTGSHLPHLTFPLGTEPL
ncbi:MAG: hypothetical protein K2Q01_03035, partial [Rickettsiales bacterium]|nr:hypothetical protein [Rickettsiales bacterium]